jgi:hypothetical protein
MRPIWDGFDFHAVVKEKNYGERAMAGMAKQSIA